MAHSYLDNYSETEKRLIPVANQLVDDLVKDLMPDSGASSKEVEISSLLDKYALDTISTVYYSYGHDGVDDTIAICKACSYNTIFGIAGHVWVYFSNQV